MKSPFSRVASTLRHLYGGALERRSEARMHLVGAVVAVLLLGLPATAQTITDGDTIKLNGVIYRLWGIDSPESSVG
jgi:endonuclease YncB( thermonuclease family)